MDPIFGYIPREELNVAEERRRALSEQRKCYDLLFAYKPTDPGLGSLEKLPAEIRLTIFEFALDIGRPIQLRTCCRSSDKHNKYNPKCKFHQGHSHRSPRRLALLSTSHHIRNESAHVMHSKAVLELCVDPRAWSFGGLSKRSKATKPMWDAIASYRNVKIKIWGPAPNSRYSPNATQYAQALRLIIEGIADFWKKLPPETTKARPGENVHPRQATISLSKAFCEVFPFNPPVVQSMGYQRLAQNCWNELEEMMTSIAVENGKSVDWTVTAYSRLALTQTDGQQKSSQLEKLLSDKGIKFKPWKSVYEKTGLMGGKHRRFLD